MFFLSFVFLIYLSAQTLIREHKNFNQGWKGIVYSVCEMLTSLKSLMISNEVWNS